MTLGFWPHSLFKAGVNTELGAHCLRHQNYQRKAKNKRGEKKKDKPKC